MRKSITRGLPLIIFIVFLLAIVFLLNFSSSPICTELEFSDSILHQTSSHTAKVNIDNLYTGGKLYKGQLHTHTNRSDGSLSPTELALLYRDAGYDFLSITDHGLVNPNIPGILNISGTEIKSNKGHMVIYGIRSNPFSLQNTLFISSYPPAQQVIDSVVDLRGLSSLAHPNAVDPWANDEIHSTHGFAFIEVCNGGSEAEDKWDYALNKPFLRKVWGTAVDDLHVVENLNKGWVMVYAAELTACSILESLASGNFYTTQGPDMGINVSGSVVTVTTPQLSTIVWKVYNGVKQTDRSTLRSVFKSDGTEKYIRVVVIRDSDGNKAWSQPLFIQYITSN